MINVWEGEVEPLSAPFRINNNEEVNVFTIDQEHINFNSNCL